MSTTIAAFALSSILTGGFLNDRSGLLVGSLTDLHYSGSTFFLLGYMKLGVIVGFFPRHILVGYVIRVSILIPALNGTYAPQKLYRRGGRIPNPNRVRYNLLIPTEIDTLHRL